MGINDIIINGNPTVYRDWGVRMGEGFLNALTEPLTPKEYIENESRTEHGKRVVVVTDEDDNVYLSSREVTLEFLVEGITKEDFLTKKRLFLAAMYQGEVTIQVPAESDAVYHLIYKGKSGDYGMNPSRTFCKMLLKFEEPNPMNRS